MPADPTKDLLLITSASGKQANALLPLLSEWKNLRLAIKSSTSKDRLKKAYPHAEVIQTDLYSPTNCVNLLRDVNVAIHIGPSYHPHEASIGKMMIDAAISSYQAGYGTLKHFILSSVLNSQLSKMLNHDCKKDVEEYIIESDLPYTILQPTTFMDNIPVQMLAGQDEPVFRAAWSTDVRFSMIALSDLAEVFKTVLFERERHVFAQYPLVSTHEPLSFGEAMRIIGENLDKEVQVEKLEYKQAVDGLLVRLYGKTEGVDPRSRDAAQRMILFYDSRGLVGNANVLEWVLGKKGVQFDEWVVGKLGEGKGKS
ncbi:NAD(P)-binding protein [Setomelanomma holmii]|uniref:NAD(P)-binding protein n=1 Tax=Setomelanomma holmii TaxID=210430 RepID=A0A9P4HGN4_9PLEO|nr:NAD(P)-binding protein [Setomelanomma holmii]